MKAGGRGVTAAHERFGLRRFLVVAQMAFSLVLVMGALLFVGTLRNLMTVDPGFRPDDLIVLGLDMRRAGFPEERRLAVRRDILRAAPASARRGGGGTGGHRAHERQRLEPDGPRGRPEAAGHLLLQSRQPRLLQGHGHAGPLRARLRGPRTTDRRRWWRSSTRPSCGSTSTAATRSARRSRSRRRRASRGRSYQIVGVVKDTKYYDLREDFLPDRLSLRGPGDRSPIPRRRR